jgi:hypothetical protein
VTLPFERTWAVCNTREFLVEICTGQIPRIPSAVRERARSLLKHFPHDFELSQAAKTAPDVFSDTVEEWRERFIDGRVSDPGGT